jgi:pimeloyl-ACP methyl ester carboxylesterase
VGPRIVRANGVELCIESFGDPADPAILLVHGVGNCMLSWDDELCARLAAGRRFVIRYDLRDAGRSVTYEPGAPQYTVRDVVADTGALIDVLGVTPAHVVGLSGGAAIGQLLALDHPDRVASLTLVSSTPGIPGEEQGDLPGATAALLESFASMPPLPGWSDRAAVVDYLVEAERPYAAEFDEAAARELAERVFDHSTSLESTLTNAFMVEAGEPWRARLGEIEAPTLVIHGTQDPLFPYAHAVALADEIPGAELLPLERTGHEYFPRRTWDVVVPAILGQTSPR